MMVLFALIIMLRDSKPSSSKPTFHRVQSTAHQPNTHVVHTALTQSARYLHTDQLITNFDVLSTQQRVVILTNFVRMSSGDVIVIVFKSGAVFWWAAILRTPSSMFDKLLYLSKSKSFAMSCSRTHNFRETATW